MKKMFIVTLSLLLTCTNISAFQVHAENKANKFDFPKNSKHNQQIFGYYMLDAYHGEILSAMRNHYKDPSINGYQLPWWKKYNTVSITQPWIKDLKSDKPIQFSYAIKVTLLPLKDGKLLGTDTLYFELEPGRIRMKNAPRDILPPVQLVKYEHKNPPKFKNKK
jgi:hypothetical protein